MTLQVADLRGHIESTLEDPALQKLLDAAYQAIVAVDGASGNVTESLRAGSGPLLMLSHPASAIVSATEDAAGAPVALVASDYRLRPSGSLVERLDTGTNPASRWRGRVDVVYSRLDREAARDAVAIELVRLDINFSPGLVSSRIGDWSETFAGEALAGTYAEQRLAILASLLEPIGAY